MINRHRLISVLLGSFLLIATFEGAIAANRDDSKAQRFIGSVVQKVISTLTDPKVQRSKRIARFRVLLREAFAVKAVGKWVLSRYWHRATKAEQTEYLALFEDLIVVTYIDRFTDYAGERLVTVGTDRLSKNKLIVHSLLRHPNKAKPLRIDWVVYKIDNKNTYRIYDIIIESISMAQTQRFEFGTVINREGRTIEGLLKVLRQKTQSLIQ